MVRLCRSIISRGPGSPNQSGSSGPRTSASPLEAVFAASAYWWVHSPAPGSGPRRTIIQPPRRRSVASAAAAAPSQPVDSFGPLRPPPNIATPP